MDTKELGRQGEAAAAEYLARQGYRIYARNFRAPAGEIDIVAGQPGLVVFVEVKTRRSLRCGRPAAAVDYRKQQKIIQTARWFIRQRHLEECLCRFDVIEVYAGGGKLQIRQLQGAFET